MKVFHLTGSHTKAGSHGTTCGHLSTHDGALAAQHPMKMMKQLARTKIGRSRQNGDLRHYHTTSHCAKSAQRNSEVCAPRVVSVRPYEVIGDGERVRYLGVHLRSEHFNCLPGDLSPEYSYSTVTQQI